MTNDKPKHTISATGEEFGSEDVKQHDARFGFSLAMTMLILRPDESETERKKKIHAKLADYCSQVYKEESEEFKQGFDKAMEVLAQPIHSQNRKGE